MDVVEFEDWLDTLGEDVSRWPEPQRGTALALLADSAEARALLEESRELRRALTAPQIRAPAGLSERIVLKAMSSAPTDNSPPSSARPGWRTVLLAFRPRPAFVFPICFILGLLVGIFHRTGELDADQIDLPAYVAYVVDMGHNAD